jgi:hypothetical protein
VGRHPLPLRGARAGERVTPEEVRLLLAILTAFVVYLILACAAVDPDV